jgi:hypothetical protein
MYIHKPTSTRKRERAEGETNEGTKKEKQAYY